MVVWSVSVQKIHETPPNTVSGVITLFPIIAFSTYSGEVPMSPKIIPSVTSKPEAVILLSALVLIVCFGRQMYELPCSTNNSLMYLFLRKF